MVTLIINIILIVLAYPIWLSLGDMSSFESMMTLFAYIALLIFNNKQINITVR